ncbi:MAG: redoxin domain-containing protein, partial [Gammaproteobacteria bacterium]|nr:redoxin domain-containing protein [Gammaproteobacteria bacterium]
MLKLPNLSKALVAGLLCAIAGASAYAAERISDFSLVDADGRFFQLSRHSNQDAVVLLAYDANSRDARRAISDLREIAEQFADQAVAIAIMDVTGSTDKVAMREEA